MQAEGADQATKEASLGHEEVAGRPPLRRAEEDLGKVGDPSEV